MLNSQQPHTDNKGRDRADKSLVSYRQNKYNTQINTKCLGVQAQLHRTAAPTEENRPPPVSL